MSTAEVNNSSQIYLLKSREQKYEDDLVDGEYNWNRKKKDIILEWANDLRELNILGSFTQPLNQVSTYISNRLRARGLSEDCNRWVRKVLDDYPEFKDPNFVRDPVGGTNSADSVFEDFDQLAKQPLNEADLARKSKAEQQEILTRKLDKIKEMKRRLKMDKEDIDSFAGRYDVKLIPPKTSAEQPPLEYQGITEISETMGEIGDFLKNISDHFYEIKEEMRIFKPSKEVSDECMILINKWRNDCLFPYWKFNENILQFMKDIMNPIKDKKHAYDFLDWLKIFFDNIVNYGAHGAGVKNSVGTGEYHMKKGKNPNEVEIYQIAREVTREQVGDKTQAEAVKKAIEATEGNYLQQVLKVWATKTSIYEEMGNPEEFWQQEQKKEMLKR